MTWFFHINGRSYPQESWNTGRAYYPGDDYIDWIGLSIYGAQNDADEWLPAGPLFAEGYAHATTISDTKPIAVLEFGVHASPRLNNAARLKARWIREAFDIMTDPTYPRFKALSYWHSAWQNEDGTTSNLRLDSSEQALTAYKKALGDAQLVTEAVFATLPVTSAQ